MVVVKGVDKEHDTRLGFRVLLYVARQFNGQVIAMEW